MLACIGPPTEVLSPYPTVKCVVCQVPTSQVLTPMLKSTPTQEAHLLVVRRYSQDYRNWLRSSVVFLVGVCTHDVQGLLESKQSEHVVLPDCFVELSRGMSGRCNVQHMHTSLGILQPNKKPQYTTNGSTRAESTDIDVSCCHEQWCMSL